MLRSIKRRVIAPSQPESAKDSLLNLLGETYLTRPDEMLMICPYGIGDIYIACALVDKVLAKRGRKNLTVLCGGHQTFIPPAFNKSYRAFTIPEWANIQLLKESGPLPENFLYAHFQTDESTNLLGYKDITLVDIYKSRFGLPFDTPLAKPDLITAQARQEATAYLKERGLNPAKTVMLAPEATSVEKLDAALWNALAKHFKKLGWQVILRSEEYRSTIDHDFAYSDMSLDKLPALAEQLGLFISLRSGLCDLLSPTKTKMVVIYPKKLWHAGPMITGTGLVNMGLSQTAQEIELTSIPELIRSIKL